MNSNNDQSGGLLPVEKLEPKLVVPSDCLGEMPDDFTIEISDFALMRANISPSELTRQWIDARAELIRRGYKVTEWFCEASMQRKAHCVRVPNTVVTHAETGSRTHGESRPR